MNSVESLMIMIFCNLNAIDIGKEEKSTSPNRLGNATMTSSFQEKLGAKTARV